MRILLDCDGVLSDFIGGVIPIINELLDTAYTPADVTVFSFAESLKLTVDQAVAVKRAIGSEPKLAARLPVLPGAVDGLRKLQEIAEIYIVTSSWDSNPTWEYDRKAWFKRHFDLHHNRIIFAHDKQVCVGDVLVDDKTETLIAWRDAHPCGVAVQWQTPHNRLDAWDGISLGNWDDLVRMVTVLKGLS